MFTALELTLVLLAAAVLSVVAFRIMRLPPMLAYLAVGILIGPHGLGWAEDDEVTSRLAQFGVVFLMFSIGLEFSLPKLSSMRRTVFGLGTAQVVVTTVAVMVFAWLIAYWLPQLAELRWPAAFAIGAALALSSTAIVSKSLTERMELESEHGRVIISVLLFQDLAVVPLLIVVPALASNHRDFAATLGVAAVKAVSVLVLLLVIGQKPMRAWFRVVAKQRSQELFMLNLLLITLGAAWITERAGLSLALGAFVAGMLISETEYKHQVEEDIKPYRDVLLGLFFITIGMLPNWHVVLDYWPLVLLLLTVPVIMKFGIIAALAKLFGLPTSAALRTGLALAQAGEFGFVLLNQAAALSLVDPLLMQLILASMVLSMLAAPLILSKSDAIVMKWSSNEWMVQSLALTQIATRTMATKRHVIVAGFGRTGQNLAKVLEQEQIAYSALDLDPDRVREAQAAGYNVSYGDAARRVNLVAAGVHRAAALVITYASTPSALKLLHFAHELNPALPVIVRSYDDIDLDKLRAAGAAEVVPEALESSLMLASHAMTTLGVPLRRVVHRVQAARAERYASLRGYFHGATDVSEGAEPHLRLHSVALLDGAKAAGQRFAQLGLDTTGAEVIAVRRGKCRVDLTPALVLQVGDIVVLRGTPEGVALAEARLL